MHPRRFQRSRQRSRVAGWFIAAAPLPALAGDAAAIAWGAYLFFAIVATVVIVLLLYQALEDEPTDDRRRDEALRLRRDSHARGPVRDQRSPYSEAARERAIAAHVPRQ